MMAGVARVVLTALVVLCIGVSGFVSAGDKAEIDRFTKQFEEAWKNQDTDGVAAIYTEDATLMAPGMELIHGRKEIANFVSAFQTELGIAAVSINHHEVTFSSDGQTVQLWGTQSFFDKDGSIVDHGKGMALGKRVNGEMKIYASIFHSDSVKYFQDDQQLRAEVELVYHQYEEARKNQDPEGVAALYTEDATLMAPGMEPIHGNKAIAEWTFSSSHMKHLKFGRQEITVAPDGKSANMWSNVTLFFKDGSAVKGKGMGLLKRVNEQFRIHVGIFNTNEFPHKVHGHPKSLKGEAEDLREEFVQAWSRQDSRGVAECFSMNAIYLPPGRDVVQGTENIAAFVEQLFQVGLVNVNLEVKDISPDHPNWSGWGYYVFSDKDGNEVDHGKWLSLITYENGKAKLYRSMFNSNINPTLPGPHDEL